MLCTVEPGHRDGLEEYGGEERETGRVPLEEVEDIQPSLREMSIKCFGGRFKCAGSGHTGVTQLKATRNEVNTMTAVNASLLFGQFLKFRYCVIMIPSQESH